MDGHFLHLFVVRIVVFVWKDENKRKKPGLAHSKITGVIWAQQQHLIIIQSQLGHVEYGRLQNKINQRLTYRL